LLPPWKKYPETPAGSIGWRMGAGEDYFDMFYRWFSALNDAEWTRFASENPEPAGWRLYQTITEHPWSD
jgi:hypothetical protein